MLDNAMRQLREILEEEISRSEGLSEAFWTALNSTVTFAREEQVPVEQLLVKVKGIWDSTLMPRGGATDGTVQRLKQDIVTQAIKAYYMP